MQQSSIFQSFIQGGFECSTHSRLDGKRLDVIKDTFHDKYVLEDYLTLITHGINTVRDGLRWHLIEAKAGYYDWSSFLPMLKAAQKTKMQVIWDLCHYGWPEGIDIWKPEFVVKFANFASAVAQLVKVETDEIPFYSPINEISFWSWAGGDVAYLNPHAHNRGYELKHQLVRATIAAIEAIKAIEPRARFVQAEPLINVVSTSPEKDVEAALHNESQFQAWDLLCGELWPGLGGGEHLLDIMGINYYPTNQWYLHGEKVFYPHPEYKSLANLLEKVYRRYNRPLFIAETGTEGPTRHEWLNYICNEVHQTNKLGVPVAGICLYPVTDYFGWDDERHCETGLLGMINERGERPIFQPLKQELKQQQLLFAGLISTKIKY